MKGGEEGRKEGRKERKRGRGERREWEREGEEGVGEGGRGERREWEGEGERRGREREINNNETRWVRTLKAQTTVHPNTV